MKEMNRNSQEDKIKVLEHNLSRKAEIKQSKKNNSKNKNLVKIIIKKENHILHQLLKSKIFHILHG
jgi:hypothetical protein